MAKGKQTFNKSERERKKQKARKEKEAKWEERSANKKGKSFEEMLAYVDENGRLSSTPPDPTRKRAINVEDIEISTSRRTEPTPEESQRNGEITFFNSQKGYGFIKDQVSGESLFFHVTSIDHIPNEGEKVTFRTEQGERGLSAVEVVSTK